LHDLYAGPKPLFENVRNLRIVFGLHREQDVLVDDWVGDDPADAFDNGGD